MHLPEAALQFRLQDTVDFRSLKIESIFKGFELRLDRHVSRYMAETFVVYAKGKQQIEQLYKAYPLDTVQPKVTQTENGEVADSMGTTGRLLKLQYAAEFVSGKVLLIKGAQDGPASRRPTHASGADLPEQQKAGTLAESISLPGVSLWIDSIEGTEEHPGACHISTVTHMTVIRLQSLTDQFL
jgi:hypothetical protein